MTVDRKTIVAAVATALISSAALAQGACMNDLQMLTSRSTAGHGKVHDVPALFTLSAPAVRPAKGC